MRINDVSDGPCDPCSLELICYSMRYESVMKAMTLFDWIFQPILVGIMGIYIQSIQADGTVGILLWSVPTSILSVWQTILRMPLHLCGLFPHYTRMDSARWEQVIYIPSGHVAFKEDLENCDRTLNTIADTYAWEFKDPKTIYFCDFALNFRVADDSAGILHDGIHVMFWNASVTSSLGDPVAFKLGAAKWAIPHTALLLWKCCYR